jgi:hypothetical protein
METERTPLDASSSVCHLQRYVYISLKYWRMNKLRPWWLLHLLDEIRADFSDGAATTTASSCTCWMRSGPISQTARQPQPLGRTCY